MLNFVFVILLLSAFVVLTNGQANKPTFRILAPKFICDDAENKTKDPSQITVRMQTKGGQQLKYRVQLYFEILGGMRNQQHNLKIWRSVRGLEKKLRNDSLVISKTNQINILNKELTSGVFYVFSILGIDDAGVESDSQNFSITFKEGRTTNVEQDGTSTSQDVTILLLGAEVGYSDVEYFVEARVSFCKPNLDYSFLWSITNLRDEKDLIYLQNVGKTLRFPPNVFRGGDQHEIKTEIFDVGKTKIGEAKMKLNILRKGFQSIISPKSTMIGLGRETIVKVTATDFDNSGLNFKYEWSCIELTSNQICESFETSDSPTMPVTFFTEGNYEVSATVTLSSMKQNHKMQIIVRPDIIASTNIINAPSQDIPAKQEFQLSAEINDLVPNCYSEWIVVKEEGFGYFDSAAIPGGLGNVTVRDVEETFLSELVDYGNNTISREIILNIPSPQDNWIGLEPNLQYKFRLIVTCPEPIRETSTGLRKNVTSFEEIILKTNGPPIGLPLIVSPVNGTAGLTVFKFSTGIAKDTAEDYPLKYTFEYLVEGFSITLGEFYENMVITTKLPYSDDLIIPSYFVCDSREACSLSIKGPPIKTHLPDKFTMEDLEMRVKLIQINMKDMDLNTAFSEAISSIVTYRHLSDKMFYEKIKKTVYEGIQSQTNDLLIKSQEVNRYMDKDISLFVRRSKEMLKILEIDDNQLLTKLLQLLDVYVNERSKMVSRNKRMALTGIKESSGIINRDYVNLTLEITEQLISKTKDSNLLKETKFNLTEKVSKIMRSLCQTSGSYKNVFVTSIVSFKVIRATPGQITYKNHSIFSGFVQINRNLEENYDCLGFVKYPGDYLSGNTPDQPVFGIFLYGLDVGVVTERDNEKYVDVVLPIESTDSYNYECAFWLNHTWSTENCQMISNKNRILHCKCGGIGYYRAVAIKNYEIATTSEMTSSIIPAPSTKTTTSTTTTTLEAVNKPILNETPQASNSSDSTSTMSTLSTQTTPSITLEAVTEIPQSTQMTTENKASKKIFYEKPRENSSNEEMKFMGNTTTTTSMNSASTVGYSILSVLIVLIAIIAILFVHRRIKKSIVEQELEIMNAGPRVSSSDLKYASFHDEHVMGGEF